MIRSLSGDQGCSECSVSIKMTGSLSGPSSGHQHAGQSPGPVRLAALTKDDDKRGSKSHLSNIGIHVQERRNSRHMMEKQVELE